MLDNKRICPSTTDNNNPGIHSHTDIAEEESEIDPAHRIPV